MSDKMNRIKFPNVDTDNLVIHGDLTIDGNIYVLSGTWMFKDVFDARIVGSIYNQYCVDFISNNILYDRIISQRSGGSSWFFQYATGDDPETGVRHNVPHTQPTGERHILSITNEEDRKITFVGTQSVSEEFYEWITNNATFTTAADTDWKKITDYVDKEIAEFDFVKIVDKLPEEGLPNREYFVRKANVDETSNDLFEEYAWINKGTEEEPNWDWEFKGTKTLEIDLSNYVKKTEFDNAVKVSLTSARVGNEAWSENDIEKVRKFLSVPEMYVDGETGEARLYIGNTELWETDITALCEMLENMGDIESALDTIISEQETIIEIQNALIGGVS